MHGKKNNNNNISKFQVDQDGGPTGKLFKTDVVFSLNIAVYLIFNIHYNAFWMPVFKCIIITPVRKKADIK